MKENEMRTCVARLMKVHKRTTSSNGNPTFNMSIETKDGRVITGMTELNGMTWYGFNANREGESADWLKYTYRVAKSGNVIFVWFDKCEEGDE